MRPDSDLIPLSPEGRRCEIARILASGIRRLLSRPVPGQGAAQLAPEKPRDSGENSLELLGGTSVTVHSS